MSSKDKDKIIHIVVVGVSGPESVRGAVGVGKSALCNRFIRPLADDYQPDDHISTISQSDFSGRVINNDHFLYWGNVSKRNDDGAEVHFSIIEQTEFVDDQSFAPLRGSNTQPYHKRCAVTKLTSAEKLMYICKYQLGEEDGYQKVVLPEPKFTVDGYLLAFDVSSKVRGRPIQKQLEFLTILMQQIVKQKRPILVVATKCDEADEHYLKEARTFAAKFKTTLVETSANEAVNVDLAFMSLAQLVDRTKGKLREVPFSEAIKLRRDLLDNVTDAYTQLLNNDVTDYHTLWKAKQKEYEKTRRPYLSYVQHLGTQNAKKMFDRHKKKLKEEHLRKKQLQYLTTLPKALEDIFPDLETIRDRTWEQCKVNLNEHPKFMQWFTILDEEWKYSPYIDSNEKQIPYDFLTTNNEECKKVFNVHVDRLQAIKRKNRMKEEFKKKLVALKDVIIPGTKLDDLYTHLASEECVRELTEDERKDIYDIHQQELKKSATNDFLEMLYEKYDLFERFETMEGDDNYVEEAREVEEALRDEYRYQALSELKNERKVMLYKHIAFMHNPTKETCPSKDRCMDKQIQTCIEGRVPRSPVKDTVHRWSETNGKLNVVLLGDDGLADELANEIRQQSVDDDYTLDGTLHSLDLRPIDGDVSQPRNYLATDRFSPQGCICTFTSLPSFQYVKSCLEKTLLAVDDRYATLRNLPVVFLFARDVSIPDSDIRHLREDTDKLAERLNHSYVVEMPLDESIIWQGKKFHESQIQKSFRYIVDVKKTSEFNSDDGLDEDEPDLRIGMALMCGDKYLPDLVLGPLVSHDTCYQTPDLEQSITVDLFLGTERKKIDVDVMSYHQNTLYRDDIHHGYILVYSTIRKASFETMRVFLDGLEQPVPTLIVGVQHLDKSPGSYEIQELRLEGHKLAESKAHCKFLPAGATFQGQTLAYSSFLKEAYEKRMETEQLYDCLHDITFESIQARTPSVSDEESIYSLPYRTPDNRPRMPGYDSENTYDTFNRPSPFARTPIQSVPIKGSSYVYGQKAASLPRRHSDLGEHPLEELYAYASPERFRERISTDVELAEEDDYKDMYSKVNKHKTHKRTSSADHPMIPEDDSTADTLYAVVDKSSKTLPKPSPRIAVQDQQNEDIPVYARVDKSKQSPRVPDKVEVDDEDEVDACVLFSQAMEGVSTLPRTARIVQDGVEQALYARVNKSPGNNNQPSDDEGWVDNLAYDQATLPPSMNQSHQRRSLPPEDPSGLYATVSRAPGDGHEDGLLRNPIYEPIDPQQQQQPKRGPPPPIKPKPSIKNKQKLDMKRYEMVANTINRNRDSTLNRNRDTVTLNRNRDTVAPSELSYHHIHNKNTHLATPEKDPTYSTPIDAVRYDIIRGIVGDSGNSNYAYVEPHNALAPGLRQRIRGKTPQAGDSPNDGEYTPPIINKNKIKPKVPPRTSIKSPPSLPDNALIKELKGVIGEENVISNRSFIDDPARHTSSDSDSRSSMDAINKEPMGRRRRSYRRRKEPTRTRVEFNNFALTSSPAPIDIKTTNEPETKKPSREERDRAEKERKRLKKEQQKQEKRQRKNEKRKGGRKPPQPQPPQKPRGPPIETLVGPGEVIPLFVIICLEYIEQEGLKTEGVYRIPGKGADSDALISKFDEEKNVNIRDMEISVHAVATAIKQFFSQLPEPLVPRTTQEEFLDQFKVVGGENFRSALPELMNKLPEVNRNVFAYMMLHLNRIMQHSAINKMTAENLSTCWWPTLLQPQYKSLEDMANHAPLQNVVITCIQDAPELFTNPLTPVESTPDPDYDTLHDTEESSEFRAESDTSMTTPIEE